VFTRVMKKQITKESQKAKEIHFQTVKNLKMAIALSGMTQTQIGLKAGLSQNILSAYLKHSRGIISESLVSICLVLKIPIGVIISEKELSESQIKLFQSLEKLNNHQIDDIVNFSHSL